MIADHILHLRHHIAECASKISPTNAEALRTFAEQKGLSIEYRDERGFKIRVRLDTHVIILPLGALNYLWCSAHLFYGLYKAHTEGQEKGATVLDLRGNEDLSGAIDLWNWSRQALRTEGAHWPSGAPRPSLDHQPGDSVYWANEFFLLSLAWILHHERAHVELEHRADALDSVRQEMQADRSATEWILAGSLSEVERQQRGFAIAVAFLAMAMLDNPRESIPPVTTHPPDMERLLDNLDLARLPKDDIVYMVGLLVLKFCIGQYDQEMAAIGHSEADAEKPFEELFRDALVLFNTRHR